MSFLNEFRKDVQGSVAVAIAVLILFLISLVGALIDFGFAFHVRSTTQSALDAAVLAVASEGRKIALDGTGTDVEDYLDAHGEAFFQAKIAELSGVSDISYDIDSEIDGNKILVTGTAQLDHDYYLLPVVGFPEVEMNFSSNAALSLKSFVAIDFLVDASGSMGIGATDADQQTLIDATGCAFSCHTLGNGRYAQAQAAGGNMRIDVARDAILNSLDVVDETLGIDAGSVTFGLHTFSGRVTSFQTSTDTDASDIDSFADIVEDNTHLDIEWTGTNLGYALNEMANILPAGGGGLTEDAPLRYLIVISDFVENAQMRTYSVSGWFPDPEMVQSTPIETFAAHEVIHPPADTLCTALDAKDITVIFINTTYLIPWAFSMSNHNRNRFTFIEDDVLPVVNDRLATCAGTANRVFEATSVEDIEDAIEDAVRFTIQPLHLFD